MVSTKPFRVFVVCILSVAFLIGCAGHPGPALPAAVSSPTPQVLEESLELEAYFQGFSAAFVFYDLGGDHYSRYNPEQCSTRLLPASTFKIMNSLIGLETGVIRDADYAIKWDGTQFDIPSWNQDHTLKTAIQNSVVWYYQELARRVGREQMQQYIDAAAYGNQDISGPVDLFWLNGTLKISADEQVEFLKRLYRDDLPFSERSMKIVKEIMTLEETNTYQLRGKTGSGQTGGLYTGWFVGYVEEGENVYFFATNIQGANADATGPKAKAITLAILQDLDLLPQDCSCST